MNRVYINNAEYNIIYQSQGFDTDKYALFLFIYVALKAEKEDMNQKVNLVIILYLNQKQGYLATH